MHATSPVLLTLTVSAATILLPLDFSVIYSSLVNQGRFYTQRHLALSGDILMVTAWGAMAVLWHLEGVGHGHCPTPHCAQDGPTYQWC